MVIEKWICPIKENINSLIKLLLPIVIISGLTAAISFVLYGRARMKEQIRQEKFYLNIHYISLSILCLLGIIYMMIMVNADN